MAAIEGPPVAGASDIDPAKRTLLAQSESSGQVK